MLPANLHSRWNIGHMTLNLKIYSFFPFEWKTTFIQSKKYIITLSCLTCQARAPLGVIAVSKRQHICSALTESSRI